MKRTAKDAGMKNKRRPNSAVRNFHLSEKVCFEFETLFT